MKLVREHATNNAQTYFVTSDTWKRRALFNAEPWARLFFKTLLSHQGMSTFIHVKTCTKGTNGGAFSPLFCVDRSIFFSKSIIIWIGSVLAALFLFLPRILPAQIDCIGQPTIHLFRLKGTVFDPSGVPVPTIEISLVQDGQIVEKATTAEDGNFDLKAPAGNYELRVQSAYFRASPLRIHLGTDFHTIFHPGELRWILEISGLNCSWATTSATDFDKEIQRFKERLKRDAQKNATQK